MDTHILHIYMCVCVCVCVYIHIYIYGLPSQLSKQKNLPALPATQEIQIQSLGQEDPREKEMAIHSY